MVETRSGAKIQTPGMPSPHRETGLLPAFAKRLGLAHGVKAAFGKLFDHHDHGDEYALKMLKGFHAVSHGADSDTSPPYEPPPGLSPMATWRGGPLNGSGSTVYELATSVVDKPDDIRARRLLEEALVSQDVNIVNLYHDHDLHGNGETGRQTAKRLLSEHPLEVRDRPLAVYDRLATAMRILQEKGSGINPMAYGEDDGMGGETKTPAVPLALKVFLSELIGNQITEAIEPFHQERAAVHNQLLELRDESKTLRQNVTAITQHAHAGMASAESIESLALKLEALSKRIEESRKGGDVGIDMLADEKLRLVKDEVAAIDAKVPAASATPWSRTSRLGSIFGSIVKSSPRKPPEPPIDMPAVREWMKVPPPMGLEKSKVPDFVSAWISRPAAGEEGKASRKQLGIALAPNKLLEGLPDVGQTIAYGLLRGTMLENWFLFSEYIQGGEDRGEASLLRALVHCVTNLHNDKTRKESQWRSLMNSETVHHFLIMLDGIYCDRSHTATETEWAVARADAKDALDYLHRMRHLLTSDEARSRGRHNLHTFLAERGDDLALSQLATCEDDVDTWHAILDSLHSVRKQIDIVKQPSLATDKNVKGSNIGGVLGMSIDRSQKVDECYQGGSLKFDVDVGLKEANVLIGKLVEMQDRQSNNLNRAIAALSTNESSGGGLAPGLASFGRLDQFRPDVPGGPPKVYDLTAIYEFLGLSTPVPERRGPHPSGTHGVECGICSEFFGFKEFADHETLKAEGYPFDKRAFHNAWKCSKCPRAVEMRAEKIGARASVPRLLQLKDDPFWKSWSS